MDMEIPKGEHQFHCQDQEQLKGKKFTYLFPNSFCPLFVS